MKTSAIAANAAYPRPLLGAQSSLCERLRLTVGDAKLESVGDCADGGVYGMSRGADPADEGGRSVRQSCEKAH